MRQPLPRAGGKAKVRYIIIDAGHGGRDPGAMGSYYKTKEKGINLHVAQQVYGYLKHKYPRKVIVMTRAKDKYHKLPYRSGKANRYAKRKDGDAIFISIHANWTFNKRYRGVETYYLGKASNSRARKVALRENKHVEKEPVTGRLFELEMKIHQDFSKNLAYFIQTSILKRIRPMNSGKKNNNGILKANFWVLRCIHMPSVLVELGYLSNKYDEKLLRKKSYRRLLAKGVYYGIVRYINYYTRGR